MRNRRCLFLPYVDAYKALVAPSIHKTPLYAQGHCFVPSRKQTRGFLHGKGRNLENQSINFYFWFALKPAVPGRQHRCVNSTMHLLI